MLALSARAASENPADQLAHAQLFAFGGVGFAGISTPGEAAFREVLSSQDAVALFTKLTKSANPQGKCYALLGLKLKNPAAFETAAASLRHSNAEVASAAGCMMSKRPLSNFVAEIEAGRYDAQAKTPSKR